MVKREFWIHLIESAWKKRPIIWLSGVRRVGKTYLCQSLENITYFDCEMPTIRKKLESPEMFLSNNAGKRIVLDEIHRIDNPSQLLKIAADHYPGTTIIATGSSTLGASKKFRDTLTGRKTHIQLTPMLLHEGKIFGDTDLEHRLLFGGLPPFFQAKELPKEEYLEWILSYWAKDIQELFHVEKRHAFMKFTELLLAQSSGMFEATKFAELCEVTRPTIAHYLSILEDTAVAHIIRPFSTRKKTEIIAAPKVYGFDTGFICHFRGWQDLRSEDKGMLWEHMVLNELMGHFQSTRIQYWRDKRHHEIDFVIARNCNTHPVAIECKWSLNHFDPTNLKFFRQHYPHGKNYVVVADMKGSFERQYDTINVSFTSLESMISAIKEM